MTSARSTRTLTRIDSVHFDALLAIDTHLQFSFSVRPEIFMSQLVTGVGQNCRVLLMAERGRSY